MRGCSTRAARHLLRYLWLRLHPAGRALALFAIVGGCCGIQPQIALADDLPAAAPGELRGTIVNAETGQPAADVEIRMRRETPGGTTLPLQPRRTRSNEQGQFVFDGLLPGTFQVFAFAGNSSTRTEQFKFDKATLDAQRLQTAPLKLTLKPGVILRVRVTSAETGDPLPGAKLQFRWTDMDDGFEANERGEIVVQALTAQQWHLDVMADKYAADTRDLTLVAPETAIDVRLAPGGEINGRIVDPSGKPLSGAAVGVRVQGQPMYDLDRTKTDDEGRYRLQYLPLQTPLDLSASLAGYDFARKSTNVVDQAPSDQGDLTLKPLADSGTVSGQIVDIQGQPIVGAKLENTGSSSSNVRRATSDAGGKFRIEKLYERNYDHRVLLSVRAEGYSPRELSITPEQLSGQEELLVTLEPGHKIRGRVLDDAGQPVAGAAVYFADGNRGFSGTGGSMKTDREGRFESRSLPGGCNFTVQAQGYSNLELPSLPLDGDTEIQLRLDPMGLIRGQVTNALTGKPLENFNVKLAFPLERRPEDKPFGGISSTRVDPGQEFVTSDGKFELKDLMNESVLDVIVSAQGYRPFRIARAMAAVPKNAEMHDVSLEPYRDGELLRVRGRILSPSAKPAAGVQVRLFGLTDNGMVNGRDALNWYMITSNSARGQANMPYGKASVTTTNGEFSFDDVPRTLTLRLYFWSDNVPAGKLAQLEQKSPQELAELEVTHDAPVTLRIKIDREAFPDLEKLAINGDMNSFRHVDKTIDKSASEIEIGGIQAGDFWVALQGKAEAGPQPGTFTVRNAAAVRIKAVAGETCEVTLDESVRSN